MKHSLALLSALLLAQSPVFSAETSVFAAETSPHAAMDAKHKALLQEHCVQCHGPEKQNGNFRVDDLSFEITSIETAEKWQKLLNQMNSGEMPPDDEEQPPIAAKTDFLDDLSNVMVAARRSLNDQQGVIRVEPGRQISTIEVAWVSGTTRVLKLTGSRGATVEKTMW